MTEGKLTWAIVILMERRGEADHFTARQERKSETPGGPALDFSPRLRRNREQRDFS